MSAADPEDARSVIFSLTRKGRNRCVAIAPEARRMEAWFLAVLTPGERRELDIILDKLFSRSQQLQAGGAPPERISN